MKRMMLGMAAVLAALAMNSCTDIGSADPLDGRPGTDGATLYLRDMPE